MKNNSKNKRQGIMTLRESKHVSMLSKDRARILDQLKRLYPHEFLGMLGDEELIDLFEEMIELPQLQHIKLDNPIKPRPNSNIYDLPINDAWWLIKPELDPEPEEEI